MEIKRISCLLFLFCVLFSASAQRSYTYGYNSTGERIYKEGNQQKSTVTEQNHPQVLPDTSSTLRTAQQASSGNALDRNISSYWHIYDIDTSCDVGQIPMNSSVSPSGGRVYSIPLPTAAGFNLTPQLSLTYNSQSGDGVAGFGWNINGLSCITVRNKNHYYDGITAPANYEHTNCSYALDGQPLLQDSLAMELGYDWSTPTGHILVKKHTDAGGRVLWFDALLPNGGKAIYGLTEYEEDEENKNTSEPELEPKPFYPLTRITDADGNIIKFKYHTPDSSLFYIDEVTYGTDSSAFIRFNYQPRTDYNSYSHFATKPVHNSLLLTSIENFDDSGLITRDSLYHSTRYGTVLLDSLGRSDRYAHRLNPLRFQYGNGAILESGSFVLKESVTTSSQFDVDSSLLFVRGKLLPDDYHDGLIILPKRSNYTILESDTVNNVVHYLLGSSYTNADTIRIHPGLYSGGFHHELAGSGFHSIQAADIDGNGIDEVVKVSVLSNGEAGNPATNTTTVLFSMFHFGSDMSYHSIANFSLSFDHAIEDGNYISPDHIYVGYGDFRGVGHIDAVLIDPNLSNQTILFDLKERIIVSDNNSTSFAFDTLNTAAFCADIDGDGRTELCQWTENGLSVWRYNLTSNTFQHSITDYYSGMNYSQFTKVLTCGDVNGDGYLDFICKSEGNNDALECRYFTGDHFYNQPLMNIAGWANREFQLQDINDDGLPDLLVVNGNTVVAYLNNPTSASHPFTYAAQSFSIFAHNAKIVPTNIISYNGASDFLVLDGQQAKSYHYSTDRSLLRSITKATDSYGNEQTNSYEKISDISSTDKTYSIDANRSYSVNDGYTRMRLPLNVLSATRSHENGTDIVADSTHFLYRDLVIHQTGLGFCGFGEVTSVNSALNTSDGRVTTTTRYDPQNGGVATRVTKTWGSGASAVSQVTENHYSKVPRRWARFTPQLDWSYAYDPLSDIETTTSYRYDEYGFVTDTYAETAVGQSRSRSTGERPVLRTNRDAASYQLLTTSITYDHIADELNEGFPRLMLGNIAERLTMRSIDPSSGGEEPEPEEERRSNEEESRDYIVRETITYNGLTQHPSSVITDCRWNGDDGEDRISSNSGWTRLQEKSFAYDTFGNTISESEALYGSDTPVTKGYTYDSEGRFLASTTDILGLVTTYSGYDPFGNPATVTDPRGNVTRYYYDPWGMIDSVHFPDGRIDYTVRSWDMGTYDPSGSVYKVISSGNATPTSTVHYGAAGREIQSDVVRFDGSNQYVRKRYYTTGELAGETLPNKSSFSVSSNYSSLQYDRFGRAVSLTEPSGRQTTWSYDGRSTTTTKDGIASTTTLGCDDKPLSVTDAGGTVTYSYRADGQVETITAPGGMVTTLTYDDQGRRASISDPISGTHTESWTNNTGGGTIHIQSNAKGTVTTTTDAYGRTTSINRTASSGSGGAFNTTYTYGTYGELTEESSNNGTGKTYSYDSKGRLYYIYDKAPNLHHLMTFYIYNANNGQLSTNFYYPDSSPSITLTHTYTRGYHTQSKVGNTIIWRLDAENQLGQPTQITTGSVTRTYSYNNNGLPTGRTMGTVMNFGYSYDAATGNMLSRSDNTRSITETFNYDALNRLTFMDDSQSGYRGISYDGDGNLDWIQNTGLYSFDDASHPHRLTSAYEPSSGSLSGRGQDIVYTPYGRPYVLSGDAGTITFTYDASGDRKKSYYEKGGEDIEAIITKYYMGPYECEIYDDLSGGGSKTSTSPDTDGASSASNNNGITTTRRLYLGGDAYSAPVVYAWSDNNAGTFYNIGRDVQGSITHIATMDGTLVAEYSYDPWGRMRDPATHALYAAHTEPSLMLGRGYTGHEHLNDHGLINMNARLYDPWLAIFLSPDPYVQAPDLSIGFNRYTYCLNNPLKYSDESGEIWYIVGVAIVGGVVNLIANWDNCDGFWEYVTAFAVGAIGGAAVMITGGAAATAGGSMLATLGVIGVGVASGAATGATNDIIRQTGNNFEGIEKTDWNSVGISAAVGGVVGGVSTGVGVALAGVDIPITINGKVIESPIVSSFAIGAATGAAGHIAGGTTLGILKGDSFKDAFYNSFNGIGESILVGGLFSAAGTAAFDLSKGINPINGDLLDYSGHAVTRSIERGISKSDIIDALKNPLKKGPLKYDEFGRPSIEYIGSKATVAINPITGKITTVHGTHTKLVNKLITR